MERQLTPPPKEINRSQVVVVVVNEKDRRTQLGQSRMWASKRKMKLKMNRGKAIAIQKGQKPHPDRLCR